MRVLSLVLGVLLLVTAACDRPDTDGSQGGRTGAVDQGPGCSEAPITPASGSVKLTDATKAMGAAQPLLGMYGHAAAIGDVNGDGWLDLFVGNFADKADDRYAVRGATGPAPDRLLLGGRDGFTVADGFPEQFGRTSGASFADLDGDGDLDLVLARNTKRAGGGAGGQVGGKGKNKVKQSTSVVAPAARELEDTTVLRNDGAGAFTEAGHPVTGKTARAIVVLDYDGDGKLDLFIVEDRFGGGASVLLRNKGDFTFEDVTAAAGLPTDLAGLAAVGADLNGDRSPDLFVGGANKLFVNRDGHFESVDTSDTFTWETYGAEDDVAGVAVGDLDRDGRPDLVLGQHYNSTEGDKQKVPVRVYLNKSEDNGPPRFEDVTTKAGVPEFPTKAPHVELIDIDNDGWLDILATASVEDGTRPAVLRQEKRSGGVPVFAGVAGLGQDRYWVTGVSGDMDCDGRVDVFVVAIAPDAPSLLLKNETPSGHWLGIAVGSSPHPAVGTVVEVYEAGGLGRSEKLLLRHEVTATVGYAGGPAPVVHAGLGEVAAVDVRITSPGADEPVVLRDVKADQMMRYPKAA